MDSFKKAISSSNRRVLPTQPGVYQFFDEADKLLYVGKANNLKRRVNQYFQSKRQDDKTALLVKHIHHIRYVLTENAKAALLLEYTLIQKYRPRYNIIFRDDKSYPYLFLSHDRFPRMQVYRGRKQEAGDYFGPYPQVTYVHETFRLLQKLFRLRVCENTAFSHRSRPCLLYQIERCSGPCVKKINEDDYRSQVLQAKKVLMGRDEEVLTHWRNQMMVASQCLDFEMAKRYRDQIRALQAVRTLPVSAIASADMIAIFANNERVIIEQVFMREGRFAGHQETIFEGALSPLPSVLSSFLLQYYLMPARDVPAHIYLNIALPDRMAIQTILREKTERKVELHLKPKGQISHFMKIAIVNAKSLLKQSDLEKEKMHALQKALAFDQSLKSIHCFDISHTRGVATVGACVVFNEQGPEKKSYRRFHVRAKTEGDDLAAMREVLQRYYTRQVKENVVRPDLIIIDGGKNQLRVAQTVLQDLSLSAIPLLAMSKGPERKFGKEILWLSDRTTPLSLDSHDSAFSLLAQIRDEAHRFAISGHRRLRAKKQTQSSLEGVAGIGPKRRKLLLAHFGGWQGVKEASIEALMKVPGISKKMAEKIKERV